MNKSPLRVGFIHPDLGIGGAERVVVDAALCLQRAGHKVTIFTGHHDRSYCFEETRDGTLDVRTCRPIFPTHIAQRLRACCALARTSHLAASLARRGTYDVIFCDLIPHVIPWLRLLTRAKILYYCHYPDNDPDRAPIPSQSLFYQLYRRPLDKLQEAGIRAADRILVNSHFTAARFRRAYPRLRSVPIEVLYPGVDATLYDARNTRRFETDDLEAEPNRGVMLLSINRFVRFKNIGLAIEALALVREALPEETFREIKMVLAGAYDVRLRESREVLSELWTAAQKFKLHSHVVFKPSCSETERMELLSQCLCLVYTPDQEHFGIGPLEAMAAGRPVIAVRSGGPMETILDGKTGLLSEPTPRAFADAILHLISNRAAADRMGRAGPRHVVERFSLARFGQQLEAVLNGVVGREVKRCPEERAP
jgi:alpha-1,3/alpha-1,6-mannosyltransferase